MRFLKLIFVPGWVATGLALALAVSAAEPKPQAATPLKPYPLKTCVVSGEKLGGGMDKPYVFAYQGREIKLCCKDCLKKFNKNPKLYLEKLEAAEKKAKP